MKSSTGRRAIALAFLLAATLLVTSVVTAVITLRQSRGLTETVDRTNTLVEANVRVISQSQRELLRLQLLLEQAQPDRDALDLQLQLVSQRLQEATLSYQLTTLGTEALLQRARTYALQWRESVRPDIDLWIRGAADAAAAKTRALSEIQRLEVGYNQLLAEGEANRKLVSRDAAEETQRVLDRTRKLLAVIMASFLASASAFIVGGILIRGFLADRAAAQERLEAANAELQRYKHVVSSTHSMVVVTDVHGHIQMVNKAFETSSGWSAEEMLGQKPWRFLHEPLAAEAIAFDLDQSGHEGRVIETRNVSRDGRVFWASTTVTPLRDDAGRITGFVAVGSDVTERHETEQLLRQARTAAEVAAQEKEAFLATMSHEIRTPLNSVLGLTDLLRLTDLDEEQRGYVETAHRSGQHLLTLLNDILDYSSLETGHFEARSERFDLDQVLDDALAIIAPQARRNDLKLTLSVDPALPSKLVGDPGHLRQILLNLLGNAVKFTDHGGVSVRASRSDSDPVPSQASGGRTPSRPIVLRIEVEDTGVGIDRDRISSLFKPFVQGDLSATRRHGGTGLGLAITKQLVEGLGGEVGINSTLGAGTLVWVELPMKTAGAEVPGSAAAILTPEQGETLKVLVAEDDVVNQTVMTHMLRHLGITPDMFANGQEAVEAALTEDYDLALLDVQMPVKDGITAMQEIRGHLGVKAPYLVAVTADALSGDRERILSAGMDDYLAKPISLERLAELLERHRSYRAT